MADPKFKIGDVVVYITLAGRDAWKGTIRRYEGDGHTYFYEILGDDGYTVHRSEPYVRFYEIDFTELLAM